MVLAFKLGPNHKTGKPQWRAKVETDHGTTIFVPHNSDASRIGESDYRWVCVSGPTIYSSPRFKIVVVQLVRSAQTERGKRRHATKVAQVKKGKTEVQTAATA